MTEQTPLKALEKAAYVAHYAADYGKERELQLAHLREPHAREES